MPIEQQELTFETEEARKTALAEIPETPPKDVDDVEGWIREQEEKTEQIEKASIKPKSEGEPTPTPTPPPPPKEEEKPVEAPPQPEDDEVVIKVKRSELPEELQKYKDGDQMVKQFGHARANINRVSDKLEQTEKELQEAREKVAKAAELEKRLGELEAATKATEKAVEAAPAGPKKTEFEGRLAALNEHIAALSGEDLDTDHMGKVKDALGVMTELTKDVVSSLSNTEQRFAGYRQESEQAIKSLKTEIDGYRQTTTAEQKRREEERQVEAAREALMELQSDPEFKGDLQTSKPLFGNNGDNVETAVLKFCEQIHGEPYMGQRPGSSEMWNSVNHMVNMFNRQDPKMVEYCQKNGLYPANFGITDKDVLNYAMFVNVDAYQRGEQIDPATGKLGALKDFRGRKVTFPNAKAAYKYMLDEGGVTQKRREEELIAAEKKGQTALEGSLAKRDTSGALIGPEGTGSPDNVGQELSKEVALEIIGETRGARTIDEERMEILILSRDPKGWAMFDDLNKANRRLGIPEEPIESDWPPRPKAQ
jgi:hypothetical protein